MLNDVLKQSIILYKSSYPGWSAKKILESIKIHYFNKLRKAHPDWPDSKIRQQTPFPGVNRVQRYLKEIAPLVNQKSPLDEKWHLGTVQEYPISPEAVKKIFELKARGKEYISIRIARWISRFSTLPLPIEILYLSAMEYSTAEEIAEISRTELNTANMDMMLLENIKNQESSGNGSKKSDVIPVRNDVSPIKIEAIPVKSNIAPVKADNVPVKDDIVPVVNKVAPEKKDALPEKADIGPVKSNSVSAEGDTMPDQTDIGQDKKDVDVEKKNVTKPKNEAPVTDKKPRETLRKWHLPDMRRRQKSIDEFLKFVEKQKDIEL